jgi:signal transduction histidine kinase/ligand-binding sensor domain-containing protein
VASFLIPALTLALFVFDAQAQYRFDHWTTDDGLPHNSVHGILQTRDGYMWFTTNDGLVRFDGVRFTIFNKSNSPGLAGNRFGVVYEDRFGDLWANLDTGIARMHRGRFTTYTKELGLPFDGAYGMVDDGQGNLIIYHNQNKQLFRWWEGRFEPFNELSPSAQQPAESRHRLPSADCWWDSGRWVCFSNGRTRSWAATELPVQRIYGVTMGDNNDFWFISPEGVARVSEEGVAQVYNERNGLPALNPALVWGKPRPVQVITSNAAGSLWVTDMHSMQSQLLSLRAPEGWDLVYNFGGFADTEDNYWFGTQGKGLFRARKQTVTAYTNAQGLNAREVNSLLEARDGSIWIGTRRDGLFKFQDGTFTHYTGADSFGPYVASLYEDRAGRLWVYGVEKGLWRFTKTGFVREIWKEVPNVDLTTISTMCEDRAGAFWIGAPVGAVRYQNGVATHVTTTDGLASDAIKVIIPDLAGGLWLGGDGGLTHYNDGKFTAWTEKDGLPGGVRSLKQDDDGTLWIGTYDSGLARFKDGRFTRYTKKDGMYDDGVFQILEDENGWFWMSCNRGVYRARKHELDDLADGKIKTITCAAYTRSDGMPSSQCSSGRWPAGIKARDGKLWFPTIGGVAVIDPANVRFNSTPPPIVIEEMHIDNQPVEIETWQTAIRDPQFAIKIEPGQEDFEIRYTAVSFINSENLRFKYKLEGLDHDWVEAGTRRTANFSRVPPGDYTFKVIAANSDGVWNMEGNSLRLSVLPPFYQTWWFLTLGALSLGTTFRAVYKYRVSQLEGRQAAQQAFTRQLIDSQEAERKRIAGELHDSLGQNLLIVKNWALVGLNALSKDNPAREHLTEISDTTSLALDEVREIAHNLRPYQLERLGLTNTLDYMMRNIKNSSDIEFAVELENIDGLLPPESEINLYRIVQEVINNVIKHSEAAEAGLAISRVPGGVQIVCRDNGKGFDPAAAASSRQSGMGLSGLTERVRILGGNYTIESVPGAGTTITINVNTTQ